MNLPTKLTLFRILLTFLIMALLFVPGPIAKAACLALFLLAAATDWWDGYLARRRNQITPLGILLDPIADKVLVIGALLAFVQLRLVRAWMVLIILIRELLITGVRLYAVSRRTVIPASLEGKHKAASQMLAVLIILTLLLIRECVSGPAADRFEPLMPPIILWSMWVAVVLTVISGVSFFWRNRSLFTYASR